MVQTRRKIDGPQLSQSQQQQSGDGNLLVLPRVDNPILRTVQAKGLVDNNL